MLPYREKKKGRPSMKCGHSSMISWARKWIAAPMPAAGSAHTTRTAIRASSGAANEFSSVPHTLGRKRKAALGTEDPSKRGPWGGRWGRQWRWLFYTLSQWR